MPRFRFRLQPVLEVRERVLDERRRELAIKTREAHDAQTALADLEADRDARRTALTHDHRSLPSDELRATYAHLAYLDRAIEAGAERLAACRAEVVRSQAKLMSADTDRRVLDTLRSRRLEAFNAEATQHEQRELDDQNARRYGRAMQQRGD